MRWVRPRLDKLLVVSTEHQKQIGNDSRLELVLVDKLEIAVGALARSTADIVCEFLGDVFKEACPSGRWPDLGDVVCRHGRSVTCCEHESRVLYWVKLKERVGGV